MTKKSDELCANCRKHKRVKTLACCEACIIVYSSRTKLPVTQESPEAIFKRKTRGNLRVHAGNLHPATPHSEQQYEGRRTGDD